MDTRYQHPPITDIWSRSIQLSHWATIEATVAQVQAELDIIPQQHADAIQTGLAKFHAALFHRDLSRKLLFSIEATEHDTRHDVAAFLACARDYIASDSAGYLHYGLTSSDLVDTCQAIRLRQSYDQVNRLAVPLQEVIDQGVETHRQAPLLGRTHGQPAEPLTLGLRFAQWAGWVGRALAYWDGGQVAITGKISGPIGTYAHFSRQVERRVSELLGFYADNTATQVVARDGLAVWANSAASLVSACGKIALDFRLMAARGEVHEQFAPLQVGSSSMPHKRNPITAEKISGMVRLARGYAAMLQPVELWEDRDISHSCVERVAVPDLLHTVCHTLQSTTELLSNARWDTGQMGRTLKLSDRAPYSAWKTLEWVRDGLSRSEAEQKVREWIKEGCFGVDHDHTSVLGLLHNNEVVHPEMAQYPLDTEASQKVD